MTTSANTCDASVALNATSAEKPYADDIFNFVYETAREVPYKTEWLNGPGDAVTDKELNAGMVPGDVVRSQSAKGRKILIVATRLGLFVLFQRYINDVRYNKANRTFIYNTTKELKDLRFVRSSGRVSEDDMQVILGDRSGFVKNIGHHIEHIAQVIERSTKKPSISEEI
jgi:hypothetical protein